MLKSTLPFAVSLLVTVGAQAQSLGDVAKAEAARRQAVKAGGKVYTNDNLRPAPDPSPGAVPVPAATSEKPQPSDAAAKPAGDAAGSGASAGGGAKDEAYWRKKIDAEREALSRAQTFVDALQSRINALATDFVNRDDPEQRNAIAADRQKAVAELDRVKKEIEAHQKNITNIQDEARRAGAPAGWVR